MAKIHQIVLVALLPLSYAAAQQTITLNDGTQFQGRFTFGNQDGITFVDQSGVKHRFNMSEVQAIYFASPPNYSNNSGYQGNQPPPPQSSNNGYSQNQPPPPPPPGYSNNGYPANQPPPPQYSGAGYNNNGAPPQPGTAPQNAYATLPAGTQIAVRTAESIHTSGATPGRTYPATIDRDVLDANGNVIIPRTTPAALVVRDLGNNEIVLDLQSVNLNGQRYALNTQDVTQTGNNGNRGLGANKRTGTYVGGGAVLGTLLGAIAGGGRGAAIGALAGAAAGAGTQVLTRGSEVKVPAETVLSFQLDQPVYLNQ